jgi:predicted RNase H-like HicB family nuclease
MAAMKTYTYTVHLEPAEEGGYVVTVPTLPGCITQGETYEEALAMAEDCVRGFLEALVKAGQPIPKEVDERRPLEALIQVEVPASAA